MRTVLLVALGAIGYAGCAALFLYWVLRYCTDWRGHR